MWIDNIYQAGGLGGGTRPHCSADYHGCIRRSTAGSLALPLQAMFAVSSPTIGFQQSQLGEPTSDEYQGSEMFTCSLASSLCHAKSGIWTKYGKDPTRLNLKSRLYIRAV